MNSGASYNRDGVSGAGKSASSVPKTGPSSTAGFAYFFLLAMMKNSVSKSLMAVYWSKKNFITFTCNKCANHV